ncbi:unannotated protein [freshwater metagenome]|uniref:Unannotated protein n=1 Tax=freshwater metagenome TaxID=449393 RepID=A0A6J7H6I1_9ZZZZ|nr:SDR family NAD(P)-dependent oxidoreductase [Actinomycetota bacterium]
MEFAGKVALVTGASRGFGMRIALELARRGADVALAARTIEEVPGNPPGTILETARLIEAMGRHALPVQTDLADHDAVIAMVHTTASELGGVDLLMNNAGMGTLGDVSETSTADWNMILAVNLTSQFLAIREAVPYMRARGGGAIVNMGSYLAHTYPDPADPDPVAALSTEASGPGITAYGVTKAAIERLTIGAAADLAKDNIRVNCIAPRWTETEGLNTWFPSLDKTHWERPEDWAEVVAVLMSNRADNLNGCIIDSAEKERILAVERGR